MKILFVTGNKNKVVEAAAALRPLEVEVEQIDYDYPEIQHDTLEPIAAYGARHTAEYLAKQSFARFGGVKLRLPCEPKVRETDGLPSVKSCKNEVFARYLEDSLPEISRRIGDSARYLKCFIFQKDFQKTVIVEDAGLFIPALGGFPGPYSAYVHDTIGNGGILQLMRQLPNRGASFKSVIGLCRHGEEPKLFTGIVEGTITAEGRGTGGFGYDPIFEPKERDGRTFAEMNTDEKNQYSHRARALRKLVEYLKKQMQ